MRLLPAAALAGLLLSPLALAQQPAPPAGAAAPKPTCQKPDEFPGRLATDLRKKAWGKDVNAYIECMKKFIDDQTAIRDVHHNAANAAIATLNKEIGEFNAAQQQ